MRLFNYWRLWMLRDTAETFPLPMEALEALEEQSAKSCRRMRKELWVLKSGEPCAVRGMPGLSDSLQPNICGLLALFASAVCRPLVAKTALSATNT